MGRENTRLAENGVGGRSSRRRERVALIIKAKKRMMSLGDSLVDALS
jgi:hypothetical protein